MKIRLLKYCGAFALAAKIAGLLPYGAFALRGFCPTTVQMTSDDPGANMKTDKI